MRPWFGSAAIVLVSLAASILAIEVGARWAGLAPTPVAENSQLDSGGWAARDPVVGWKNKPGINTVWTYTPSMAWSFAMRVWDDNSRATSPNDPRTTPDIVFVGASITQGYGLNDAETMAWQVQAAHPNLVVKNFGTGGYGAYQALLTVEGLFKQSKVPNLVIFCFFYSLTIRDIAPFQWVQGFRDARGEILVPPYMLSDGTEHPPIFYSPWPLESQSSLVSMARLAYLKANHPSSMDTATDVAIAIRIFARMQEIIAKRGSTLVVAVLDPWPIDNRSLLGDWKSLVKSVQEGTPAVRQFLKANADQGRLEFIECSPDETLEKPEFQLPDSHPNALANAKWAFCINRWLDVKLKH
jgi:hypothetical protein